MILPRTACGERVGEGPGVIPRRRSARTSRRSRRPRSGGRAAAAVSPAFPAAARRATPRPRSPARGGGDRPPRTRAGSIAPYPARTAPISGRRGRRGSAPCGCCRRRPTDRWLIVDHGAARCRYWFPAAQMARVSAAARRNSMASWCSVSARSLVFRSSNSASFERLPAFRHRARCRRSAPRRSGPPG